MNIDVVDTADILKKFGKSLRIKMGRTYNRLDILETL